MIIKNKNCIVTISSKDHLDKSLTCIRSAKKYNKNIDYYILYLDNDIKYKFKNIKIITINNIIDQYKIISSKYGHATDSTICNLQPVILLYLLNFYEKIIYVNSDIYFINEWNFIYDQIDSMLLIPNFFEHNYDSFDDFFYNITYNGYFSNNFIGVSRNAFEPLRFLAKCFYNKCDKKTSSHNFMPIYIDTIYKMNHIFPNINVLNHKGCNISIHNDTHHWPNIKNGIFLNFEHSTLINKNKYKNLEIQNYFKKYSKLANKYKNFLLK